MNYDKNLYKSKYNRKSRQNNLFLAFFDKILKFFRSNPTKNEDLSKINSEIPKRGEEL